MSLPKSVILRQGKISTGNAQSNTMFCKGNMNLQARRKKCGKALARFPAYARMA
jgi:hypothetical protein